METRVTGTEMNERNGRNQAYNAEAKSENLQRRECPFKF